MKSNLRNILTGKLIMGLLLVFLAAGCSGSPEKSRKPSEDISRGLPLSTTASSSLGFEVSPDGEVIRILINEEETGARFHYYQLNQAAEIVQNEIVDFDLEGIVRSPEIVSHPEGFHLIWAARPEAGSGWLLWYANLDPEGNLLFSPRKVSRDTEWVNRYQLVEDGADGVFVIWEDGNREAIMSFHVDAAGERLSGPSVLIEQGENPSARRDPGGNIHLAWMRADTLMYAAVDALDSPLQGTPLLDLQVSMGNTLNGPVIGVTDQYVHCFWSILRRTGMEAGTAVTEFISFPVNSPDNPTPEQLNVFSSPEDWSQPYQGRAGLREIISPPEEDYLSTDFVFHPQTSSISGQSLAVAVSANQEIRLDRYIQIVIGIFEGGEYQGYTIGTRTTQYSRDAEVEIDRLGNIHLVWRDGAKGNQVYYATTSAAGKRTLNRITIADLPTVLFSGGLEALTGVLLFPFAFPWMAVGLLIMIVYRLIENDEDISQTLSRVLLGVSLAAYQISKLLFLPDIMLYVPFSAWLDIPIWLAPILQVGVPILVFGLGLLAAEIRRKRMDGEPSSLVYYLLVVIVDMVLTLAIYGVIFLGEY